MKVQVVSCNHRTAELGIRERLAFSTEEQLGRAYDALRTRFPGSELVVLSTCNRIELYTAQEDTESAPTPAQIAEFFSEFHTVSPDAFVNHLLEQTGPEAVRHLFEVACGLDSMVLGEPQIVSQVKEAYESSRKYGACGPLSNALFQGALRASSRVRTETRLAEGRVSIASVAVGDFGKSIFDHFDDKTVLVIGAGEMAEETIRYLKDEGVRTIVVVNRTPARAETLAAVCGGTARPFAELDRWMAEADVIVSTTGANRPIVDAARLRRVRKRSGPKPVFILDLGAPRDFDPAAADIDDNVFLYDIDDLQATCEKNKLARAKEMEKAGRIVQDEADRFMHEIYHRATGPIIKRLRDEWHAIRREEMDLLEKRLGHLDATDLAAVERTVERIINKLLHPPLEALRDEARDGTPHGLLDALKRLFHLRD